MALALSPSAHTDTFCRDHLPPAEQWPEMLLDRPELAYPDRLNCAAELLDAVVDLLGGDRPCLRSQDGTQAWTYADLLATANRVAHVLVEDLSVVPGNRVLLRGPNNPWLAACWFGVLKAGAVAVTTMPLLRAKELSTIGETARVSLSLCDHRFLDDLEAADHCGEVLAYGGSGEEDLAGRAERHPATFDNLATAADDVAMLAFTSGTTGRPKATMHFHRDVLAIADTFSAHVLRPGPDDVFIGTPPLAFTFGLGGLLVFPLRVGASTVLVERATPAQLAELVAQNRVTTCFTAPTAYRAMLAAGGVEQLASLHTAVSAGEHLPVATWRAFKDATGVGIVDGIGSTEMLHIFVTGDGSEDHAGSTGVPVPGYVATVLDDAGEPVPRGTPGRLAVKGPTGCRYLDDPRQLEYVQHGWNITGDTFSEDESGCFWYHARSDDMIISSGYNIASPEVEEGVGAHPDVEECAVVGVPDPDRGTRVKAYVVLREGVAGDEAKAREIQEFTKAQIAPYKYPRSVEFIDSLPRSPTGKLQRFRLRD